MPHSLDRLETIIMCDDIRAEIGNKFSLMGVAAGDMLVPEFPAVVSMAFFIQYKAAPDEEGTLHVGFRLLQDESEMVKGGAQLEVTKGTIANLIIPHALVTVQKEMQFRMMMRLDEGEEREIISRKILKGPVS